MQGYKSCLGRIIVLHPIDYRYNVPELEEYLSNEALLRYMLKVEAAYVQALADVGVCSEKIAKEISSATNKIKYDDWLEREKVTGHDVRAMVQLLQEAVSDEAKPYVHLGLTSNDVVDNAMFLMLKDATKNVVIPEMKEFIKILIDLSRNYKSTVQIGRTHGQHAIPTTFGKEIAVYVDRLGNRSLRIKEESEKLRGKISGAVGTKASFSLIYDNPDEIELMTLQKLGLIPVNATTQIVPKEYEADYFAEIVKAHGVLTDLANDMRQLQRTEIGEVEQFFGEAQVGSSTMPHKRNPEAFENICSQYKATAPRFQTILQNIVSEHQRDLTDSAARRYYYVEILVPFVYSVKRMTKMMKQLRVNEEAMKRNLLLSKNAILAEPFYVSLALAGRSDAHEHLRRLTALKGQSAEEIIKDPDVRKAIQKLTKEKQKIFEDPSLYIGHAERIADKVADYWEEKIRAL